MGIKADRRTFLKLSSGADAAALGGLPAGQARAESSQTLTLAWDTDIDSLDPHVFKSVGGYAVQCNLYDPVVSWKVRPVEAWSFVARSQRVRGRHRAVLTFERSGTTVALKIRPGRERGGDGEGAAVFAGPCDAVAGLHALRDAAHAADLQARRHRSARRQHRRHQHEGPDAAADGAEPSVAHDHHGTRSRAGEAQCAE
jgi:hypothetical protein